jgi:hypothetical protein
LMSQGDSLLTYMPAITGELVLVLGDPMGS